MKRWDLLVGLGVVGVLFVALLGTVTTVTACNGGGGTCPDKAAVVPGASCSDDKLQCAYDLMTLAVVCDRTTTTIATSCTCTNGTWACPSAVECDSGAAEEAGAEAGGVDAADVGDAHDD